MLHRAKDRTESGFTLIELLVVIIIIGILAAISIPVFLNQRKKGNDAANKSALRMAAIAQEVYITDNIGSIGTTDATALKDAGFVKTSTTIVYSALNTAQGGYCLIARNTSAQDSGGGYPFYMEYDSLRGGILNNGAYRDVATVNPGGGACGTGRGAVWVPIL